MFFQIGTSYLDNFSHHYNHNNLVINLDAGWNEIKDHHGNQIFYKGYIDEHLFEKVIFEIADQEEPLYFGNFCLIKCFDKGITIKTDRLRSFPIWYDPIKGLTNLTPFGHICWSDSFVMITNSLELVESKFSLIGNFNSSNLDLDNVIGQVDNILDKKIQKFAETNQLPIKVFLSGGIDTMLLYSYFVKLKIPHELIGYNHIDFDYFYLKNHDTLSKFWGYKQIHHWKEPCVLVTGAPGDEFTVRSPTTANMMLRAHDLNMVDLLDQYKNSLHYTYFNDPKYLKLWQEQRAISYQTIKQAIDDCLNLNINDWQHWHLGNTLSYTPLRDIRLFVLIARLNKEQLIEQIMNSVVQKKIIEQNAPQLLDFLSTQKNSNNNMENLTKLFC